MMKLFFISFICFINLYSAIAFQRGGFDECDLVLDPNMKENIKRTQDNRYIFTTLTGKHFLTYISRPTVHMSKLSDKTGIWTQTSCLIQFLQVERLNDIKIALNMMKKIRIGKKKMVLRIEDTSMIRNVTRLVVDLQRSFDVYFAHGYNEIGKLNIG